MQTHKKTIVALTIGLMAIGASAQNEPAASTGSASASASPNTSMKSVQAGTFFVPESTRTSAPGFAHTHYVIRTADGNKPNGSMAAPFSEPIAGPDSTEQVPETPCSLGHLYVNSPSTLCAVGFNTTGGPTAGGSGAIAIVDAYDNPDAASDLASFDSHFHLPAANFVKLPATGNGSCKTVPANANWALEESLDIEWAHVFAPNAQIVLVEACSSSFTDLLYAESVAFQYIVANDPTGGQVSNSWGGGEYTGQIAADSTFRDSTYNQNTGFSVHVQAFASTGDDGFGVEYPSTNPWVVAAGGTSLVRNTSGGGLSSENCWSGAGGGTSAVETYTTAFSGGNSGPWANFQYPLFGQGSRAVPDMSSDADPASGVYVLSQYNGGWYSVGGTSVSSPSLASISNRLQNKLSSVSINGETGGAYYSNGEDSLIYAQLGAHTDYAKNFYDVVSGSNGSAAKSGWDYCTGVGAPRGLAGK